MVVATKSERHDYRTDIDGLRAVAILPILLLHCGFTSLRGGFAGVDVFFVISGFLITTIILRDCRAGTFSIGRFYRHRIVRILPALVVMVVAVLMIAPWFMLPIPLRDLGTSAAATAAFGSNIYFYATTDYFAQAAELKPLIHTWSLAVEEQFYVLFPLLLIAMRGRADRSIAIVLTGVAGMSLAIGLFWSARDPSAGYYLLPSRYWQLMAGALVALGAYPKILRRRWREAICWAALVLLLASYGVLKPTRFFPTPLGLIPVAASAALIAYAPRTSVAALLSFLPLRRIGWISFSAYLWHRPIIAFYLTGRTMQLGPIEGLLLLAAILAVAALSWGAVERPTSRRWRAGGGFHVHAAAAAAVIALAAGGLFVAHGAQRLHPLAPREAAIASWLNFDRTPAGRQQYSSGHCFVLPYDRPLDRSCLEPSPDKANVLLIGDSHAAQLSAGLRAALAPANLMQATAAGCRPLLETRGLAGCRKVQLDALRSPRLASLTAVILAGRWFAADVPDLARTVRDLRRRGARNVVVLGPMVEYDNDMPDLLVRALEANRRSVVETAQIADRAPLDRLMRVVLQDAGAIYYSHVDNECPRGRCALFALDGSPMHVDHSHFSPAAALSAAHTISALVIAKGD